MEWQPIETAPKDGCNYLVYQPEKKGRFVLRARICSYGDAGSFRESTHWMSLPAPPASQS
jgi:hypothetical protein